MGNRVEFTPAGQPGSEVSKKDLSVQEDPKKEPNATKSTGEAPTLDQYREIAREEAQVAAEGAKRAAQSLVDKSESRVRKDTQQLKDAASFLKDLGMEIPEDTLAQGERALQMGARLSIPEEPTTDPVTTPVQKPAAPTEPGSADKVNPITLAGYEMMSEAGIDILEEDPEFEDLDKTSGSTYITSLARAIDAKKKRIEKSGGSPNLPRGPKPKTPSGITELTDPVDILNFNEE